MQPEYSQRPRFMHQLKSRVRTPSNFTTINAFSVKTRKKTNYWNANQEGKCQSVRVISRFDEQIGLLVGVGCDCDFFETV